MILAIIQMTPTGAVALRTFKHDVGRNILEGTWGVLKTMCPEASFRVARVPADTEPGFELRRREIRVEPWSLPSARRDLAKRNYG